ncbi:MAG: VOC family protein [Gemmatimonadales bacterium]|jgi:predicted enzyme related to lactoylglutathione lyase|nr:VOC family protein [Gemmatimonadales bacterium]MDZ4259892.1 VOC family protein [Gemmatimonadales bacterium]MDZ4388595.1 VOC family protein [Gemmatimonadales bacterium]
MNRPKVAGLGGVVLFADRADSLAHWYEQHLGIFFTREPDSHEWWSGAEGGVAFAIHQAKHPLGHDRRHCELTWRVDDLDALIEYLSESGTTVEERQESPDGDFAWLDDPEGNRIELWQAR